MDAKFVVLFHFSQRYPKIPVFDESHKHRTGISFDLMSVRLHQLPALPPLSPALKCIFKELEQQEDAGEDDDHTQGQEEEEEEQGKGPAKRGPRNAGGAKPGPQQKKTKGQQPRQGGGGKNQP